MYLNCFFFTANARLWLTKCVVKDFATGIECFSGGQLSLQETKMVRCGTAVDLLSNRFELSFRDSLISQSKRYAISITDTTAQTGGPDKFEHIKELAR